MSTLVKDYPITKLDIKRIKHADYVCFDLDLKAGLSQMRPGKRPEHSQNGYWEEYTFDVNADIDLSIGYQNHAHDYPNVTACDSVNTGYNLRWSTVVNALREGDIIRLEWYSLRPGDKNGGYIGNAQCTLPDHEGQALYYETLTLVIIRKGQSVAEYPINHHMVPANSAQTVKWYGKY